MKRFLMLLCIFLMAAPTLAQRDRMAEVVTVQATDGLTLVGDFYSAEEAAPSVVLIHMLNGRRTDWQPFIPILLDEGYNVLTIDLRGHGETRGERDWPLAERDMETWLDWLTEQPTAEDGPIAVMGASIGANLALRTWAYDERCTTAVALSPGLDYRGVETEAAVADAGEERSLLLIAGLGDPYSADSVRTLAMAAAGELGLYLVSGGAHGNRLLEDEGGYIVTTITDWLARYLRASA